MTILIKKSVNFNLNKNTIHEVYSEDEYDRHQIDSILYLKCYKRINQNEWSDIFIKLNYYKMEEMIVHKESLKNTKLHI